MRFRLARRIVSRGDGTYRVGIEDWERRLLASLPADLAALVEKEPEDPWLQRLFPTAYPKDPEREQEWRLLMSVDLHERRRQQLQLLAETADATSVTEEQLLVWTQALNDLRLYIGTRLDLSEETTFEDFTEEDDQWLYAVYDELSTLQAEAIDALSESL